MTGGWLAKRGTVHFFTWGIFVSLCGKVSRGANMWLYSKSYIARINEGRRRMQKEEYKFCAECERQAEEV